MIPRFQHILVPLDFTPHNLAALDVAFEIAVQNQSRVTLLHVVETIEFLDTGELQEFYDRLGNWANTEMESYAQRFQHVELSVDWKVRYGKRAQEIARFSSERDVQLIVLSSHPIDRADPSRSFNTVSYQVSILCPCAVLLVK